MHKKKIKIFIFIILGIQFLSPILVGSNLTELEISSIRCLEGKSNDSCLNAIDLAERLQRYAALNNQYSCQTRALGLSSRLIMARLGKSTRKPSLKILKEVRRFCNEINLGL